MSLVAGTKSAANNKLASDKKSAVAKVTEKEEMKSQKKCTKPDAQSK